MLEKRFGSYEPNGGGGGGGDQEGLSGAVDEKKAAEKD